MNPPVIDAILDEEIWKHADIDSLLYGGSPDDFDSPWTNFDDILVSWRAAWSSQTNRLYVAVEVHDDIKGTFDNANYDEDSCYPWRDDSIEFFTDGDNLGEYYYPHYDVAQRWRVTGLNHRNLGDYPTSGYHLYDGDDFITAVRYDSDSLWFCEAEFTIYDKFPDSPHNLKTGDIIGWDIWYNDSDDEIYNENLNFYDREQQIGWCYRGICYRDAQFFGEMLLQGKFNSPPPAPTLLSPADGSYLNTAQPEICWEVPVEPDSDSLSFRLEIATDAGFENHIPGSPFDSRTNEEEFYPAGVVSQHNDSCTFQPSFYLEDGQYWCRVTARDPFEAGPVSVTNSFTVDTQSPVIDHFRLLNPHYGKNWYDRIRESTISLEIQYDEEYPQRASIDAGSLKDPDPNHDPPAGDNQTITFDVDIYTAIDGNYVLTAYLIDRAGNISTDTVLAHIDTTPPRDTRAQSPQISSTPTFTVSWAGGTDGSGVGLSGEYDVFVSIDGEWRIWKKRFSGKSDNYNGQFGHNYSFEAAAYDLLGHREDSTGVAESATAVIYSEIDTIPPIAPIDLMANGANPSRWQISNSFIITWQNPFDPSNLSRALYKLGAPPGSNFDTTATASTIPPLKIGATEEFGQLLYLWLMDGSNNVDYRNHAAINLRYDATPPVVEIKYPTNHDIMEEAVPVRASIFDVTIKEFQLDYQMDWHREWQFLYKNSLSHSCEDSILFNWQNSIDSGSVQLKLTAYDKNGLSASDSVVFILENENSPRPTAKILQPKNNAYLNGWISIQGYAADVNFLKYGIRLTGNGKDSLLIESMVQKRNEELHAFDSRNVPDGNYELLLTAWNYQQRCSGDKVSITIDNTPPVARLISPSADTISCCVKINGVADDANLREKILCYSTMAETDPTKQIFISHNFGEWNTTELNGYYHLYLRVTDHGGLSAEDSRLFYIDNQKYDPQQRFSKRCENAFLTIYPNSYPAAIICLQKVEKENIQIDPNQLAMTNIIYEIYSNREQMHFDKRALLNFDYSDLVPGNINEEKLIIYKKKNNGWQLAGGTPDAQTKEIYTSIDSMGIYALCENGASQQPDGDDLDLSCQPRVFSPRNPGAENSVAISFYLETAQEVTIRIYNPSGRIVKNLIENKYSSPGNNVVMWDGKDSTGRYCRSGLYIIVTRTKSKVKNQTVMVLNN